MGKLILYGIEGSPPVRTCLLTLRALDLPYEFKVVDLLALEHLSPAYVAKNPQHTVPMLEDDGNIIWDSHAICAYLVRKYAKDDALYPRDFLARAVVDQRLHFDSGALFEKCLRNTAVPLVMKQDRNMPQSKLDNIVEGYDFLEAFLADHDYMAGDNLTLADLSIVATATSLVAFVPIDAKRHPRLSTWIKRLEKLPYYMEANGVGAQKMVNTIKAMPYKIVQQ